jgi:hypothetical protein
MTNNISHIDGAGESTAVPVDKRQRVSVMLTVEMAATLEKLKEMHGGTTSEAIRHALEAQKQSLEETISKSDIVFSGAGITRVLRNKRQIITYSSVIILALQEALDYDPRRHHNQPKPDLRIEDANYLSNLRSLVKELRRLNNLLAKERPKSAETGKVVVDVRKHVDLFLTNYTPTLAKGSAYLTIGVMAALLHSAGLGSGVVDGIMDKVLKINR